jgi:hypothetical protein
MNPRLAADGVDRHDVGVMQVRGGLDLDLEPLDLSRVHRRRERQKLQSHTAAKGDLFCLVDDTHPATTDLSDDLVVAKSMWRLRLRAWGQKRSGLVQPAGIEVSSHGFEAVEALEAIRQSSRHGRVLGKELPPGGALSSFASREILLEGPDHPGIVFTLLFGMTGPIERRVTQKSLAREDW